MVLMYKPSVIESPSGRSPEKAPRWDLMGTEGCDGGKLVSWLPGCFQGIRVYIGERSRSVELRGAHEGGGRASLPRGRLVASLTSTPSLLDCICSKKDPHGGFVPFDIPFLRNTEIGKKTAICTGPSVNRLVPKII